MTDYIQTFILYRLPVTAILFLCVFICRRIWLKKTKKSYNTTKIREAAILLFIAYLSAVAAATVISTNFVQGLTGSFGFWENLNLIPFRQFFDVYNASGMYGKSFFVANIFGNIGLFIPVGFFIPLLWDVKIRKALLYGCLISCCIEILQLPLIRITDIDDVILNTAGAALGCLMYCVLRKFKGDFCNRFKIT
jgi:glycopeptide antibiotics resistance protein